MSFFLSVYTNLCNSGKLLREQYGPGSGLHGHHIVPRHMGGTDDPDNFTYLTVREHIIAHYLLWKIYNNVNDLRSMYMLGANLTPHQRRQTGLFCVEQRKGIHNADSKQRAEWARISYKKNMENNTAFAYWASPEGRKERASLGGKASLASGNNTAFAYWSSPEGRKERARMGAAAAPKKPATNGIETKKFFTEEERSAFIASNPEWRIGVHWTKFSKKQTA